MLNSHEAHPIQSKWKQLANLITGYKSLLIAFSGGIDSSLLCQLAYQLLGSNAIAGTVCSELYPRREYEQSRKVADFIGIKQLAVPMFALNIKEIAGNQPDRCYYCKREMFTQLISLAHKLGIAVVVDGSNYDDEPALRPGFSALQELGIKSPLREVGLTKSEIRSWAGKLGLPNRQRAAFTCLATRFPYGEQLTPARLEQVSRAEDLLWDLGFHQVRVRWQQQQARIELQPEEIDRLLTGNLRQQIITKFNQLGFRYVTLDLAGYQQQRVMKQ